MSGAFRVMAGNARFESLSASPSEPGFSGPYSNGKRGMVGPNLDRSGSFREGSENQLFSSGFGVTKGGSNATAASGNLPPLSKCLSLDPIPIVDRKIERSVELRRVMGLFVGNTTEDNSISGAPVAEDLKRLRSSVVDTCNTARGRAIKLDEHLHKLDKYCDGVISKKPTNDQPIALNSKMGTQIYRNPTEIVNQRVEDRPKNVLLNKRVRTSVAETRAEFRGNVVKRQAVAMAKENGVESDILEEKIQRLPAGGEGWDKKMKRKRSVGTVNGEPKRSVLYKVVSEPSLQSNDTHSYRLGASNNINKLERPSLSNGSSARFSPRNELEGPTRDISTGSNKEKILTKGNNKLNTRDENYTPCGSLVTKGKASRTPRNGAMVAASSSPSTPRLSGTPENWENVTGGSKIPNNRKRAAPSGPSSPNMAQWVGQRPQKMSRTRRANLVSPVINQEEKTLSSDSCSHSDGPNGPLLSKQFKQPKLEPVEQSPHRLSESEESVGGQTNGQNVGPTLATGMKAKSVINEENGEGVRKRGPTVRRPLIARASSSLTMVKPIRSNKPGCEKNGSKLGRPLKKLSERKGFPRLGNLQNNGSETTGNDDREELLAAANHARNASYLACSSPFWKKMEPIFAPVSLKDKSYLSQQLKEHGIPESFLQLHGHENNIVVNIPAESTVYKTISFTGRKTHVKHQGSESFSGKLDSDKTSKEFIPLFQRVLSALIIEDTIDEELEEQDNTSDIPQNEDAFFSSTTYDTFQFNGYEPRKRARTEHEHEHENGTMFHSVHSVKVSFSSNGSFRNPNDSLCEDVVNNFISSPQVIQMESFGISSFDNDNNNNQYEQMRLDDKLLLELNSIGLYPELVPKLDDKEDAAIKHEINQLKTKLRQQNYKKKACLEKICEGVGNSSAGRELEQLALDKLVELAYRKLLATRGPSRSGIPKIPKQVALAFGRRTLAKCRKFGKSGVSCFSLPPLRDILYAPLENQLEPTVSVGVPAVNNTTKYIGFQNPISSDEAFAINGPISNRGKKKEILLENVGTVFGGSMGQRKPKQKSGQPPKPGNGFGNQSTRSLHPVQPSLNGPNHNNTRNDDIGPVDPLDVLDPIDELVVGGGPQDLTSLLNFDEEDLQDHYSAGLEIPMDDLTELNMF